MFKLLFGGDPQQSVRMFRHLAALIALFAFTVASIFFYYQGLYNIEFSTLSMITGFFWAGLLLFTLVLRTGLNLQLQDPSLTKSQMLWVFTYMLTITYLLNDWRALILMTFFGVLSFGYFKLPFRDFLSVSLYAILGYLLIILYLFINEPERINVKLELFQLLAFSCTIVVMLYTGSAIHRLRQRAKLQHAELQKALDKNQKLATMDELTGLFNRRYFMDKLTQQKALSERNELDFVVCFCDLDHFKQVNDRYGHHTGDIVLQKFAEILKESIREIDIAARFGGEEFVALLVNTELEPAINVAERIRTGLETYNFSDIAPSLHVTVSIGMANFKQFNTIQETLMTADDRMYLAKKLGRNRVVSSDEDVAG